MSPEQAEGQRVDSRSDIFSFGSILFEMLAGRPAFLRPSPYDTVDAIVDDDAPTFAEAGVVVQPAIESVVLRCLEKSPASRFQSASDLVAGLEELSHSL